jgi:hypothetical protein
MADTEVLNKEIYIYVYIYISLFSTLLRTCPALLALGAARLLPAYLSSSLVQATKQSTQATKELRAETFAKTPVDVRRSVRPFLRFTAWPGPVTVTLNYNWNSAYADGFTASVDGLDVGDCTVFNCFTFEIAFIFNS